MLWPFMCILGHELEQTFTSRLFSLDVHRSSRGTRNLSSERCQETDCRVLIYNIRGNFLDIGRGGDLAQRVKYRVTDVSCLETSKTALISTLEDQGSVGSDHLSQPKPKRSSLSPIDSALVMIE